MKGRIHSFESFGTVDGPGIRFIIFMQGCNLQCKFCQNRDTWDVCGGMEYSVPELLAKIERYKSYFVPSGGGVTISGGEPLAQQDFLIELLTALKAGGIHTAIDTAGNFDITDKIKSYQNILIDNCEEIYDELRNINITDRKQRNQHNREVKSTKRK